MGGTEGAGHVKARAKGFPLIFQKGRREKSANWRVSSSVGGHVPEERVTRDELQQLREALPQSCDAGAQVPQSRPKRDFLGSAACAPAFHSSPDRNSTFPLPAHKVPV